MGLQVLVSGANLTGWFVWVGFAVMHMHGFWFYARAGFFRSKWAATSYEHLYRFGLCIVCMAVLREVFWFLPQGGGWGMDLRIGYKCLDAREAGEIVVGKGNLGGAIRDCLTWGGRAA